MGNTDLAVQNCADTMKRQLAFKEYEIKDWAVNCVNIAEYFVTGCKGSYGSGSGDQDGKATWPRVGDV